MKLRVALPIALALIGLLSSGMFLAPASAQGGGKRFTADTGVISPNPNQVLRITVASDGPGTMRVRFNALYYTDDSCNEGVCTNRIGDQDRNNIVTLAPGESASYSVSSTSVFPSVRAQVAAAGDSITKGVVAVAQIIDARTGEVVTVQRMSDHQFQFGAF